MKNLLKIGALMLLGYSGLFAGQSYYMITDFSSIPASFVDNNATSNNDNAGVLKDETSNGLDILSECNAINPTRYDKCYYPLGDLRNEKDGWLNNNNGTPYECVQQPGSGEKSDCPVKNTCAADDKNCEVTPYNRLADWTTCGNWRSGGEGMLLSWLECNYDSLHLRKQDQYLNPDEPYTDWKGITTITKEAQRMYDSAVEFKESVVHVNENLIPLFGIRFFAYWPHKNFVDEKEISNAINTYYSELQTDALEQKALIMEMMANELSMIMEETITTEKKKITK